MTTIKKETFIGKTQIEVYIRCIPLFRWLRTYFNPHSARFSLSTGVLKETNEAVKAKPKSTVKSVRNDVDQDVFLMFSVVDENLSWYLEENIQKCSDLHGVVPEDEEFEESNLMHGECL